MPKVRSSEEHDRDYWTIKAMKAYGGGFVKALAEVCSHADDTNLERIKLTWTGYWKQYEEMGKSLERNQREKE